MARVSLNATRREARGRDGDPRKYAHPVTRREWLTGFAGLSPGVLAAARRSAGTQSPAPDDVTTLSIAQLADAFAAGRLTPIDVTAAYLARIDREDPHSAPSSP